MKDWIPPSLPSADATVERDTILEKDKSATRPEYRREPVQDLFHPQYRAEGECAHHGVDAGGVQGYSLARQA
jgi:hypothetical protein